MKYTQTFLTALLVMASSQIQAAPPVHHYEYDANGYILTLTRQYDGGN